MANLIPKSQYTFERSYDQHGEKFFPLITIVFNEKRDDGKRWYRTPDKLDGYWNSTLAQEAANKIQDVAVYDNGLVVFSPSADQSLGHGRVSG